jgi:hypothetical protein
MNRTMTWIRPSVRTHGRVAIVAAALVCAFSASPAAADGPGLPLPGKERTVYSSASAFTTNCATDGDVTTCADTYVFAFTSNQRDYVCVQQWTPFTNESGCSAVADGAITIDKHLDSATLAPTTVTLDSGRGVTVAASFAGVGEATGTKGGHSFEDGPCRYTFAGKTAISSANARVTIDGEASDGSATLVAGKDTYTVRCK